MMDDRLAQARVFLARTDWAGIEPVPFTGDASARRYFRLDQPKRAVLMDAPTEAGQDVTTFQRIAVFLRENGLSAPEIYAAEAEHGFLLLEDLGDGVFARLVEADPSRELPLYQAAMSVSAKLATLRNTIGLPVCDAQGLARMIAPAYDWYRWAATGDVGHAEPLSAELEAFFAPFPAATISLRDYHAENLIWLPGREADQKVGLLDFQDAFVTVDGYDLASLVLDARRDVSPDVIETVTGEYADLRGIPRDEMALLVAALGAQRNLRILGVFTRLALKLGKPRYLDFLPRVWRYVTECVAHPALSGLAQRVHQDLPAPTEALLNDLRTRCGTVPDR